MSTEEDPSCSSEGHKLSVVVVTGLSGSGKTTALNVFEDMGFFTVDGLPALLAEQFVCLVANSGLSRYNGIALGMDLRETDFIREYEASMLALQLRSFAPRILFFEARDDVLMKRYATTRRPHPLEKEGFGLEKAIKVERRRIKRLRKLADLVVDTSTYSIHDLRRVIQDKWNTLRHQTKSLRVHIISFGFKYGTPSEADMVFDLRFLPNPYFDPELRALSGRDQPVVDYVLSKDPGKGFLTRLIDFLSYVLEQYEEEGRFRLTIAIGCTGGRHRSVAIAEALANELREKYTALTLEHRHLELG